MSHGRPGSTRIVKPRWEWRTFGNASLAAQIDDSLRGPTAALSEEIYILSTASPQNVKIRGGRLEIKVLDAIDPRGLEQWRPTLVVPFPIGSREITEAHEAWGLPAPVTMPRHASVDVFLADVVAGQPPLHVVHLTKRRAPLLAQGCAGEIAELLVDGRPWISVALEDVDPERVLDAVRHLGLADRDNENYPIALKRIVGLIGTPVPSRMEDDL
jgi:exopolyphosphatase/guanosine-5'-triphosphate,3'-diphosphate pyrophosphatase